MSRICLISVIGAIILAGWAWRENKLAGVTKATPTPVTVSALTLTGAPDGNRHVMVSNFRYTDSYVYVENRGFWTSVWMPITDSNGGPPLAIIKSSSLKSENAVNLYTQNIKTLKGILTNDISSLGSAEQTKLQEDYPGVSFSSLPVIDVDKSLPSRSAAMGIFGGSLLLFAIAGITGLMWYRQSQEPEKPKKKKKKQRRQAEEVDEEADEFEVVDDDDRPRRRRAGDDDEDQDDDRPQRRRARDDDYDDDDDDDRPRRRRSQ